MRLHVFGAMVALLGLSACYDVDLAPPPQPELEPAVARRGSPQTLSDFLRVVNRVQPVAERMCRERLNSANCDFKVLVDRDTSAAPNAYQTLDDGRPVILFTETLIRQTVNEDELAFIFGHEAAHHIRRHIPRVQAPATIGAILAGGLAEALGGDVATVETAQKIGGTVTATRYTREFELEADALGTEITARAGYDPLRGAEYFNVVPDPRNQFLSTHPPNAERIATVRRTAAGL